LRTVLLEQIGVFTSIISYAKIEILLFGKFGSSYSQIVSSHSGGGDIFLHFWKNPFGVCDGPSRNLRQPADTEFVIREFSIEAMLIKQVDRPPSFNTSKVATR
jgi:hypothetical protein